MRIAAQPTTLVTPPTGVPAARDLVTLADVDAGIRGCRACPRLVQWREAVAQQRRAAYRDDQYWGAAVPGFGCTAPEILIVGLAPGAHGANRTGRLFTGDRSGDWLFASLFRVGLASLPYSVGRDDGQHLYRTRLTAAVHCAPPANRPTTSEARQCGQWLDAELLLLAAGLSVIVVLGGFAWQAVISSLIRLGVTSLRPRPAFGHGRHHHVTMATGRVALLASYHPSQQNTFTGRLTAHMMDEVLATAVAIADARPRGNHSDVTRVSG